MIQEDFPRRECRECEECVLDVKEGSDGICVKCKKEDGCRECGGCEKGQTGLHDE